MTEGQRPSLDDLPPALRELLAKQHPGLVEGKAEPGEAGSGDVPSGGAVGQPVTGRAEAKVREAKWRADIRRKQEKAVEATGVKLEEPAPAVPPPPVKPAALPMPAAVERELKDAGVTPDDPLFPVLRTLADTVQRVADGSRALNESVQAAASAEVGNAVERIGAVEEEALERLASALDRMALAGDRRLHWTVAAAVGAGLSVAVAVGAVGGWFLGRSSSVAVAGELGEAFAAGPDAGRVWLRLWRENDPVKALERCGGSAGFEESGRRGCWVPLWLEPAPPPR